MDSSCSQEVLFSSAGREVNVLASTQRQSLLLDHLTPRPSGSFQIASFVKMICRKETTAARAARLRPGAKRPTIETYFL